MHNQFYLGSLNSIFLVEEGVDLGREDVDRTSHDNPLCAKVLDLWTKYLNFCWSAQFLMTIYLLCNINTASESI